LPADVTITLTPDEARALWMELHETTGEGVRDGIERVKDKVLDVMVEAGVPVRVCGMYTDEEMGFTNGS